MINVRRIGSTPLRLRALVYGPFGVGKTYLASTAAQHPDMGPVLIVNIEGGTVTASNLDKVLETEQCFTVSDVDEVFWAIVQGQKPFAEYNTIVIDSGSALQQLNLVEVARANAKGNKKDFRISQRDYGDSTVIVLDLLRRFRNLDKNVIVTAGMREEYDVEDAIDKKRRGPCYVGPDLTPALARKIMHIYDHIWCLQEAGDKRVMLTHGKPPYVAKTRGKEFAEALGATVEDPNLSEIFDLYLKTQTPKEVTND